MNQNNIIGCLISWGFIGLAQFHFLDLLQSIALILAIGVSSVTLVNLVKKKKQG